MMFFDEFDETEPMTPLARETYREELVPRMKRLLHAASDREDVNGILELKQFWCLWRAFASRNGPAPVEDVGNLVQRDDLQAGERDWRPRIAEKNGE